MNQWNYYNSQNLKYIEDQVAELKNKHPEAFPKETASSEKETEPIGKEPEPIEKAIEPEMNKAIMDILEEQLIILQNIQQLLEKQQKAKKRWNIF